MSWTHHRDWLPNEMGKRLPPAHLHFAVGVGEDHRALEVVADFAAAIASGDDGCVLGPPKVMNERASRGGWMGIPVGAAKTVVIITIYERQARWQRAIRAALLHRGALGPHPIVISATRRGVAQALNSAEFQFQDAEAALGAQIGVLIVDAIVFGPEGSRGFAAGAVNPLLHRLPKTAVLVLADNAPAALLTEGSAVLETSGLHLTLARSATGQTWLRKLSLQRIALSDGDALVVVPGDVYENEGTLVTNTASPPAPPPKPVAPESEPNTRWAVMPVTRPLASNETAPWSSYDRIVTDETAAVRYPEQAKIEGIRLIEIVASDQDGRQQEAQRRVQNVLHLARTRGVERHVRVVVSTRTVRRWAA